MGDAEHLIWSGSWPVLRQPPLPVTRGHLGALDVVYAGIIEAHREAIDATERLDPVTQDMLIGQSGQLEEFHWFVRAHLESPWVAGLPFVRI